MRKMAHVAALALLSACTSQQQVAEQRGWALGEQRYNSPEVVAARSAPAEAPARRDLQTAAAEPDARDDVKCRSYGAKRGSQEYINCRMSLVADRDQRAARDRALAAAGQAQREQAVALEQARQRCRSRALIAAGATMMAGQSPYAGVNIGQGGMQGTEYASASGC